MLSAHRIQKVYSEGHSEVSLQSDNSYWTAWGNRTWNLTYQKK